MINRMNILLRLFGVPGAYHLGGICWDSGLRQLAKPAMNNVLNVLWPTDLFYFNFIHCSCICEIAIDSYMEFAICFIEIYLCQKHVRLRCLDECHVFVLVVPWHRNNLSSRRIGCLDSHVW